jgi:predicted nuclease of predicted toxin-antitoxin system
MKWLVDAQLPKRLSERLNLLGHDMSKKLLWITLGNISNNDLLALIEQSLTQLENAFGESNCVELTSTGIRIHK